MGQYLDHDWFPEALPDNVQLGKRSWLYSTFALRHYASRRPQGLSVGNDSGLYNGTFFDLGPEGEVVIGDYCALVGAIICSNARIIIEDFVFIAHEVVLADEAVAVPVFELPEAGGPGTSEPRVSIRIRNNAWIGARAIILKGADIGENAIVGAAAVVNFKVPAYTIVAGNPARIVGDVRDPAKRANKPNLADR